MKSIRLEKQEPEMLDDATKAAIEAAQAEARNGECVTLKEARAIVCEKSKAWRQEKQKITAA